MVVRTQGWHLQRKTPQRKTQEGKTLVSQNEDPQPLSWSVCGKLFWPEPRTAVNPLLSDQLFLSGPNGLQLSQYHMTDTTPVCLEAPIIVGHSYPSCMRNLQFVQNIPHY